MSSDRGEIIIEERVLGEGFTALPNVILVDRGLSYGAKQAYALLLHYSWRYRGFPGQATMALDMAATDRTVRKYLKELEDSGLVTVRQLGLGKPNTYVLRSVEKWAADRKKSSGPGGKVRPVQAEENVRLNDNTENQQENEDERSLSFFGQVGERWGRTERDTRALAKSMSKYPRQAVAWAEELLTARLSEIDNPAAWLNAVVPRLADELAQRRRGELTQRQEDLVVIRATADFYGRNEDPARVRAHLLQDFGDADLVDAALDQVFGKAQVEALAEGGG